MTFLSHLVFHNYATDSNYHVSFAKDMQKFLGIIIMCIYIFGGYQLTL